MRILITPSGTDGDVKPTTVLANFLRNCGHEVFFYAPPNSLDFIRSLNFEAHPLSMNYREFATGEIREITEAHLSKGKIFIEFIKKDLAGQFEALEEKVEEADIVVASGLNFATGTIAEFYKKKFFHILHIPEALQTRYFPPMMVPALQYPSFVNSFLWKLNDAFFNFCTLKLLNEWREKHGLEPAKSAFKTITSCNIVSADKDLSSVGSDVKTLYHQTPYWHVENKSELDEKLTGFIDAGTKPVYIGFGSMAGEHEETLVKILPEISRELKIRFIICSGWGYKKLECLMSDNIYVTDYIPHLKLFPKVFAAIHHGAAGTTHAAALAGIPQILIPHGLDQFGWALKIRLKGLGPRSFNAQQFSKEKLYKALNEVISNENYSKNAESLGKKLQNVDRRREMEILYDWMIDAESLYFTKTIV